MFGLPADRRLRLRATIAGAASLLVAASVVAMRHRPTALAATWAALMLLSFVGWGAIVNRWLAPDREIDWGLRAGWGMALSILVGGYLCMTHLAGRTAFVIQVIVGNVLFAGSWVIRRRRRMTTRRLGALLAKPGPVSLLVGGYSLAAFAFVARLGDHGFQPSDDPPLYFVLARKLIQAGSLWHPYAGRRISTFGGHAYLHALFGSVCSFYELHVVDGGIGLLMVFALVVGLATGGRRIRAWHAPSIGLAILLLYCLSEVRVNTASLYTGVAAVLTLYRTIHLAGSPSAPAFPMPLRRNVALGALATACILLRTSSTAMVLPLLVVVFAWEFVFARRRPWAADARRSALLCGLLLCGAFAVALLPWSLMLKKSCGTFFYPLGKDNLTAGWTFLKPAATWEETAKNLVLLLFNTTPISVYVPFAIAGMMPVAGPRRSDVFAVTVSSVIGIWALARGATAFRIEDAARYDFAFVVGASLIVIATAGRSIPLLAMATLGVAMHVATTRDLIRTQFEGEILLAGRAFRDNKAERTAFDAPTSDYAELQSKVPAGATLATAVHEPWRFDFGRNEIFVLDVLGGMGPAPGWPVHRGPEALDEYLRTNGVKYLAWVDWGISSEFYGRAHWQSHLTRLESYLSAEAPIQLDAMEAIEKVTAMHKVVFRGHGMTLVELASPP